MTLAGAAAFALIALSAVAQAETISGRAVVTDGDTLRIGERRIRLQGIDAPERDQLCTLDGQRYPCGERARQELFRLVEDHEIACDVTGQDRYGRSLATCIVGDGVDIAREMVRQGWAFSFVRYSRAYDADEAEARAARAGLWRGEFTLPWDYRQANR